MVTPSRIARNITNKLEDAWLRIKYKELKNAFKVKSHLKTKERIVLYELALTASSVAEIGSYVGASACCLGAAAKRNNDGRIICIDTWNNDAMTEGGRDTWREFSKNTAPYADYIIPVRGFSTEVVERVGKESGGLDLLFIDGDHSYEGVKADWDAYKSLLKPGAVVVFHDYGWADGVQKVVKENVMQLVKWSDELPNMWWGSVITTP